jgi:hypothetical protein
MADLAIIVVVDASLAVGVQRRCDIAALVMVMVAGAEAAMRAAAVVFTVAATMGTTMRGRELRSAQTKHDCQRKNRYRL